MFIPLRFDPLSLHNSCIPSKSMALKIAIKHVTAGSITILYQQIQLCNTLDLELQIWIPYKLQLNEQLPKTCLVCTNSQNFGFLVNAS